MTKYRAQSATFLDDTSLPGPNDAWGECSGPVRDNMCGVPVGAIRNIESTGYWMMLRPLSAGEHDIHFSGKIAFKGGELATEVTYKLTVAP